MYESVCNHFLQVPHTCFDLSLTLFESRNLKKTKIKTKTSPKLSVNFLIGPPNRVLPKDSHYFPLDPIKGGIWVILGSVWWIFGRYLGSKSDQKPIQNSPKHYTIFLIEMPKRVLPKDSHYFLLGPIKGGILALFGEYLVGVWKVF